MSRKTRRIIVSICVAILCFAALFHLINKSKKVAIIVNKNDAWRLYSTTPDDKYGTYIGNGFISSRIMGDGTGSQNKNPLPCYMAGLYCNEAMVLAPNWCDFRLYNAGSNKQFVINKNDTYLQTLDMHDGTITTQATWKADNIELKGTVTVFASRVRKGIGIVRYQLTSNQDAQIRIEYDIFEPDSHLNKISDKGIINAPNNEHYTNFKTTDNKIFVSLAAAYEGGATFSEGKERDIWAIVSLAKSDKLDICEKEAKIELNSCRKMLKADYKEGLINAEPSLVKEHINAWNDLWKSDVIIEGNAKDQQAVHSCMFYLLESIREDSDDSIPPMGLSNTSFNGHIFWDADTWMFPALILQHPDFAKSIVDYRFRTLAVAKTNAKKNGMQGAEYAWESGASGIESAPANIPTIQERHINGDVALAQWQYYLFTGDENWLKTRGFAVIKETADYWVSRVTLRDDKTFGILKVVPPDESADIVDNSVYTNAIAKLNLEIAIMTAKKTGAAINPKWKQVADNMYIPFIKYSNRFLAYDGYTNGKIKQADTELLIYPLQFDMPGINKRYVYKKTADFYFRRVNKKGPAMSASVHSVIASRLDDPKAYEYFQNSYKPFMRGSFNYFNEKQSKVYENMNFLTGAGGVLQAVIFGFGGVKLDYNNSDTKNITTLGKLPVSWKKLTISNAKYKGKTFDIVVNR